MQPLQTRGGEQRERERGDRRLIIISGGEAQQWAPLQRPKRRNFVVGPGAFCTRLKRARVHQPALRWFLTGHSFARVLRARSYTALRGRAEFPIDRERQLFVHDVWRSVDFFFFFGLEIFDTFFERSLSYEMVMQLDVTVKFSAVFLVVCCVPRSHRPC